MAVKRKVTIMAITFRIAGGTDASKFNINATSGVLAFNAAPDFENPGDANKDNIYEVTVGVSDGKDETTQNIKVTVTDVADNIPPQITSPATATVPENSTTVMTVIATDPDAGGSGPPPSTDWPSASNTGPTGTLETRSGDVASTKVNDIIRDLKISGSVQVRHAGVKVLNCEAARISLNATQNVTIQDCRFLGGPGWYNVVEITGNCSGSLMQRCDISNGENGIMTASAGLTFRDNYIHDLYWDPSGNPHRDLIQVNTASSANIIIDHNSFYGKNEDSACITMTNEVHPTITNNYFSGSAYQVRIEGTSSNAVVSGNTHIKNYVFGYLTVSGTGHSFTNNTYDGVLWPNGHP